jgi:hypothetical protein
VGSACTSEDSIGSRSLRSTGAALLLDLCLGIFNKTKSEIIFQIIPPGMQTSKLQVPSSVVIILNM